MLLATATDPAVLREATSLCGELQPGRMTSHREDLDYMRVFASSRLVVGHTLRDIRFPEGMVCSIAHVRRGDADLMPRDDLTLEFGDRVGLLVNRAHMKPIRAMFGDSIKGTAELSFISIGIGAALGLLVGLIPVPIPGVGTLALGLAALLLVALVLGRVRRLGPFVWTMPLSANLVLRNFGLTIFLVVHYRDGKPDATPPVVARGDTRAVKAPTAPPAPAVEPRQFILPPQPRT